MLVMVKTYGKPNNITFLYEAFFFFFFFKSHHEICKVYRLLYFLSKHTHLRDNICLFAIMEKFNTHEKLFDERTLFITG